MTPEEKAKELAEKFWHKISGVPDNCGVDLNSEDTYVNLAKQCALISVGEIIIALKFTNDSKNYVGQHEYWNKVKNELLK